MANDRSSSAQVKKNTRAEEWLRNAVKDKHVRMIPFSEISKVKYNVAKGGSGTIHLGAWRNMHVAIKEQHNTNDLIKELKMHKQVHDSNYIVKFFGITKHPLTHDTCIVMQFAENGCLQDFLETNHETISWLTKYRLAWEIASGLDFIHRENIFHTDLHSRNILIDTAGKALITDFGLSKSVNKTIYTTKAGLFGVVPYVAPERMQNPTYTYNAKCDIYSLGVILWELSSCVIPFEIHLQDVMLAVNIISGTREKTVPGTAVEYDMLYRRCWDGLPQNRPQMDIVLSELVELLAAEQLHPRPVVTQGRSARPPRPLSSESLIAPSTPFPYDIDATVQSSPENTTHMRPASPPSRPGARQSIAQGLAPIAQAIPSVPSLPDHRTNARVSFLGDAPARDQPLQQRTASPRGSPTPPILAAVSTGGKSKAPSPTPLAKEVVDGATAAPAATATAAGGDASAPPSGPNAPNAPPQLLPPIPTFQALALTSHPRDSVIARTPPIPALPETAALALASGLSMTSVVSKLNMGSIKTISTISPPPPGAPPPPPGISGQVSIPRVISPSRPKVISPPNMRGPPTISPPVGRAPKIVSPAIGPSKISPPAGAPPSKLNGSPSLGPTNKPIAPPAGPPPPKGPNPVDPPRNPNAPIQYTPTTTYSPKVAPTKSPTINAQPDKNRGSPSEKKPTNQDASSYFATPTSSPPAESRPTPARNIPMGFPVVTPLGPPVWGKRAGSIPSPVESEPQSLNSSPGTAPGNRDIRPISFLTRQTSKKIEINGLPSTGSSPSAGGSPKDDVQYQINNTRMNNNNNNNNGGSNSPSNNNNNNIITHVSMSPQNQYYYNHNHTHTNTNNHNNNNNGPMNGHLRNNQNNNSDDSLHAGHFKKNEDAMSTETINRDLSMSALGFRSARLDLGIAVDTGSAPNNRVLANAANNHHQMVNRSNSPTPSPKASPSTPPVTRIGAGAAGPQGFFPVVDTARAMKREQQRDQRLMNQPNKSEDSMVKVEVEDSVSTVSSPKGASEEEELDDSRSTTDARRAGGQPQQQPSPQVGPTGDSPKPRVQFDNFYSLADPYKNLNINEPVDFFTAVTQSDLETIERSLKSFPSWIHTLNGFWPFPTAILLAARSRNAIETMKLLVKHGAALDKGDANGTTVLHYVCEQYPNPSEAVLFLAGAGANCNIQDNKKRSPLMVLLQNTHLTSTATMLETMRILFKFGATAKSSDQAQKSTLHYAIQHCREPTLVIEMLLKKGADVKAKDANKNTPLHMVLERMDNEELVQMLLLYGADPGLKNQNKRNALCVAAEHLRVMSAWFLLENDLMSSSPDTIKKANELCSKADGPDKNAKPLFKNLLSDWQGKEGKIRRIHLAQDCVMRVQRTPDMKTIDQTQAALEFLESVGAPLYPQQLIDQQQSSSQGSIQSSGQQSNSRSPSANGHYNNGGNLNLSLINGGGPGPVNGNNNGNGNNSSNGNNNGNNNGGNGNNNVANGNNSSINTNGNFGTPIRHQLGIPNASMFGAGLQVKELRLAEGVEPLKQTMVPVRTAQQLEKEREALRKNGITAPNGLIDLSVKK